MAGSKHERYVSVLGTLGVAYAALATFVGLVAVLTGTSGLGRAGAVFLLATLVVHFGRVTIVDVRRVLLARRATSLGADVRDALAPLGAGFQVTRVACDEFEREDHVVVGPTGIFVIVAADSDRYAEASERGLFPDSRAWWRDMIDDCHIEALRAGERLRRSVRRPVTVHPVLCLRSGLVTVGRMVRGVRIVHLQDLARLISDLPVTVELDPRQIEIASAALSAVAQVIPLQPRERVDQASTDGAAPHLTSV